jgi:hypothetical protein
MSPKRAKPAYQVGSTRPFSAPLIVTKSFQLNWTIERYSTPAPLDLFLQSSLQLSFLARSLFDSLLTSLTCCGVYCSRATTFSATSRFGHVLCNLGFPAEQRSPKGGNPCSRGHHTHFIEFNYSDSFTRHLYHTSRTAPKMHYLRSAALAALGMWLVLLDHYHVCWY